MTREATKAFGILPTLDGGYDVICEVTGRRVDHRATAQSANGVAFALNGAARTGELKTAWGSREPWQR